MFSGDGSSSRDYTDFSETEALIEAGRTEATEVLRRHGLINPVQQPRAHPAAEPPGSQPPAVPAIPPERTSEDLTTH